MPHPVYRVFISSTFSDLVPERKAVDQAIDDLNMFLGRSGIGLLAIDLQQGAAPRPPLGVCLEEVRRSDIIVSIIGFRYGSTDSDGISFSEHEFDEAGKHSKLRLAYYKSEEAFFLPSQIDRDTEKRSKLEAFKAKIDSSVKRDVFRTADELRSQIVRAIARALLAMPMVLRSLRETISSDSLEEIEEFYAKLRAMDFRNCARIVLDAQVKSRMRRLGLLGMRNAMLMELLELNSFEPAHRIDDPIVKAQLLFEFLDSNEDSPLSSVALAEADRLTESIADDSFDFDIALRHAHNAVAGRCKIHAVPFLRKMLRSARKLKNPHERARAAIQVGDWFRDQADHRSARRWYWRAVSFLIRTTEICKVCLCQALTRAGQAHFSCHEYVLGINRLGKALMVARIIPGGGSEANVLLHLGRQFWKLGKLRESIAAYIEVARLVREFDPTHADADISNLLAPLVAHHGGEQIREMFEEVKNSAADVIDGALQPFEVSDFAKQLGLVPGDSALH